MKEKSMKAPIIILIIVIIAVAGFLFYRNTKQFPIPRGESIETTVDEQSEQENIMDSETQKSTRKVLITDNVKHSIPLNEILSGGVPKDGIPSIDNPKFIGAKDADEYLDDDSVGLGFIWKGVERFYPYQVLVWHEIVNDTVAGDPILVTYCPLCATGIVFDPKINGGASQFGVSGKLWQSNLLMYNRSSDPKNESLWSQVLGEAVLGEFTGIKLTVLPADTVKYGSWKKAHPDTEVLSRETGLIRSYGRDPYGNYYTDDSVGFGATFNDDRLHPKEFVFGIEIDNKFKAYRRDSLKVGTTKDEFRSMNIEIEKDESGVVRMFIINGEKISLPHIDGFWFSWLAVHPDTELFK